ncbi:MAG TPA: hypothetical protein VGK25_10130 [Ignavibacteria bacterium]|jgi:hypothetical protein
MLKKELEELLSAKNGPCISIIVPFTKFSSERKQNPIRMKKAIREAEKMLIEKYGNEKSKDLIEKINKAPEEIDFLHPNDGVGIFISHNIHKIIIFPLPVTEKITVSNEFEIRDVEYFAKNLFEYYLLILSKGNTRFFKGYGNILNEINDDNFPAAYVDDHEYPRHHYMNYTGSSPKSIAIDKSITTEKRLHIFLKHIDEMMHLYLSVKYPLIIAGVEQNLSYYKELTKYCKNIILSITGNFDHYNEAELSKVIVPEINKYIEQDTEKLLKEFDELVGKGKAVCGISEVWKNASEGKGEILIVEKDYRQPAAINEEKYELLSNGDSIQNEKLKKLDDAVNDIIGTIIKDNGDVVFVENERLIRYGRIALILRYSNIPKES